MIRGPKPGAVAPTEVYSPISERIIPEKANKTTPFIIEPKSPIPEEKAQRLEGFEEQKFVEEQDEAP